MEGGVQEARTENEPGEDRSDVGWTPECCMMGVFDECWMAGVGDGVCLRCATGHVEVA